MTVSADNNAIATITGLGPGRLTWEGCLVTINNSRVFKGKNTLCLIIKVNFYSGIHFFICPDAEIHQPLK
jgi:hypothetical protein